LPTDAETQKRALLNRTDVRSKLLEYAAIDAQVKLEVARQYPSVKLSPGYLWDQGDNVWSLAASLLLPASASNRLGIRAAQARRDVAAAEFIAMQSSVIVQAQAANELYTKRIAALERAQALVEAQQAHARQAQKRFDVGYIDRVDLTEARIQALSAESITLAARLDVLTAQGSLEEALQIPLGDANLPALPDPPATSASPSTGIAKQ
jgi:outer membrane protein TolC